MTRHPLNLDRRLLEAYAGKTILLTGASGFLGYNLLQSLLQVPCTLRAMTRRPAKLKNLSGKALMSVIPWEAQALTPWEDHLSDCDIIFHLAGQTSMRTALQNPILDAEVNVHPILDLIHACRRRSRPPSIIFASTASIFGCPEKLPVNEDFPDRPMTPYCLHKKLGETYLKQATQEGAVHSLSLRLPNIFGSGPETSSPDRSILNRMLQKALRAEPLTLYGEGLELRDYLFVADALTAFLRAGLIASQALGNFYVVGSGQSRSIRNALFAVQRIAHELTGRKAPIEPMPAQAPLSIESRDFEADFRRFQNLTAWYPETEFESGLRMTAQYFLEPSTNPNLQDD